MNSVSRAGCCSQPHLCRAASELSSDYGRTGQAGQELGSPEVDALLINSLIRSPLTLDIQANVLQVNDQIRGQ